MKKARKIIVTLIIDKVTPREKSERPNFSKESVSSTKAAMKVTRIASVEEIENSEVIFYFGRRRTSMATYIVLRLPQSL